MTNPREHPASTSHRSRIIRGGLFSGASVFFSMAALLLVAKLITNSLGPKEADVFFLILLCSDFLNLFSNCGLASALPKLVGAAEKAEEAPLIRSVLTFQWILALLISALFLGCWGGFLLLAPLPLESHLQGVLPWAWLIPPLFSVGVVRDTAMAMLAGRHAYGRRALAIIVSAALQVMLIALWVWRMGGRVDALALCTLIAYAVALAWMLSSLPKRPLWNRALLSKTLRFSFPLYLNTLLHFFFERFDTFLIALLLRDPGGVAIYEIAKRFPLIISRALGAALTPFLPTISGLIADQDTAAASRFLLRSYHLSAVLGYAGSLGVLLLQEPLVLLLSNENYLPATQVMGLLCVAIALAVQTGLMGQSLIALGKPAWVTAINAIMALISVAANLLLIPRFGMIGAGGAALIAIAFSNTAQSACVMRQGLHLSWRAWALPHLLLALVASIAWAGGLTIPARLGALLLFLAGALALRLIRWRDLIHLSQALR